MKNAELIYHVILYFKLVNGNEEAWERLKHTHRTVTCDNRDDNSSQLTFRSVLTSSFQMLLPKWHLKRGLAELKCKRSCDRFVIFYVTGMKIRYVKFTAQEYNWNVAATCYLKVFTEEFPAIDFFLIKIHGKCWLWYEYESSYRYWQWYQVWISTRNVETGGFASGTS